MSDQEFQQAVLKRLDQNDRFQRKVLERFDDLEAKMDERFNQVDEKFERVYDMLASLSVNKEDHIPALNR